MISKCVSTMTFFLTGVAAGVVLTFLTAPYSGAESRHRIGSKAKEGVDLLRAGKKAGEDYIKSCGTELRDMASEVIA